MIRKCDDDDFDAIYTVINDSAKAYKGAIPPDRYNEPYMSREKLKHEIDDKIVFYSYEDADGLAGVMGIQRFEEVSLIRHAYVRTAKQNQGIGSELLAFLKGGTESSLLVGTWAAATWAIRFYEKHGFTLVTAAEKDRLLKKYWTIPDRQIETSVVLALWRGLPSQAVAHGPQNDSRQGV